MDASHYDRRYAADDAYFGRSPSRWITTYLDGETGGRVLDLGSGQGRNALFLAEKGYRVRAVDSSSTAVERLKSTAASRGLNITAECRDITTLNPPRGTFDIVLAITVLCHLKDQDVPRVAGTMMSALSPGGLVLTEDFTPSDPGAAGRRRASEFAPLVRNYFSPGKIENLFAPLDTVVCRTLEVEDESHGETHGHGIIRYVGRRI
ncbi:MAG: class I SAM-dependent methyltransferase [Candidatus Brocadiia bacterium]